MIYSTKRIYLAKTQVYRTGLKLVIDKTPPKMRVRIKRYVFLGIFSVFLVAVLRANWGSGLTLESEKRINGFRDLEGSQTVLKPLVIHNAPPAIPKDESSVKVAVVKVKDVKEDNAKKTLPEDVLSMKPPTLLPNYKNPCWIEGGGVKCLPFFHLIGVDKSGTTDLWYRLTKHPDLLESSGVLGKETHWWSWRRFGFDIWTDRARIQSFEQYVRVFDRPAKTIEMTKEPYNNMSEYHRLVTGEGSPTVFWDMTGWDKIPQNKDRTVETAYTTPHCIHHLTPGVKLIVIFRNPTERLYSDYLFLQLYRHPKEPLTAKTFHNDVLTSIQMLQQCREMHTLKHCLFNKTLHINIPVRIPVSFYALYLKEWLKVFPRENILILRNEDYAKDIRGHVEKTFNFLEMRKLSAPELDKIANLKRAYTRNKAHKSAGDMLPETRTLLDNFHRDLNLELAQLLGDDKFTWTDKA